MPAMLKKPVETEVRTPTDTWSGLGFSKSMPAEAVKELRCVNRRSYKSYLGNNLQVTSTTDPLTVSISIISVGWKRSSNEERVSISGRVIWYKYCTCKLRYCCILDSNPAIKHTVVRDIVWTRSLNQFHQSEDIDKDFSSKHL